MFQDMKNILTFLQSYIIVYYHDHDAGTGPTPAQDSYVPRFRGFTVLLDDILTDSLNVVVDSLVLLIHIGRSQVPFSP
jgi:hypothetical protein